MQAKMQKWGNSQGIRITKSILELVEISIGDTVEVTAHKGKIIIKSSKKVKGKYNLKDLVSKMPNNYKPEEMDWGKPQGKEIW